MGKLLEEFVEEEKEFEDIEDDSDSEGCPHVSESKTAQRGHTCPATVVTILMMWLK